jgi:hypothetical protein
LVAGEFSRRNRWARVAVAGAVAILFELVGLALLPILGRST